MSVNLQDHMDTEVVQKPIYNYMSETRRRHGTTETRLMYIQMTFLLYVVASTLETRQT